MELGDLLKNEREKRGWTLRQVENKLSVKDIKYSHSSIKRLENGDHEKIPIKVLAGLSEIYRLNKVELFNLAGASLDKIDDDRVLELSRREKIQREKFLEDNAVFFFNDESVSEEDKDKLMLALNNAYFRSKEIKKDKKNKK